jgi:ketosteroid isomerase-like protein
MSRQNVEIVKDSIDAYNREDWDGVLEAAAPDFELDWSRSMGPGRGVYGLDQARRFFVEFAESWESVRVEPDEFIETGDFVVVPWTTHVTGRDGIEVVAHTAIVYEIRGEKIQRVSMYQERQDALEAVGPRSGRSSI